MRGDGDANTNKTVDPESITIEQEPTTGDAIVISEKPDGTSYPSGTEVTISGVKEPIVIGENGNGKVPNAKLPHAEKSGDAIVTEPDKAPSEPVVIKTPARIPIGAKTDKPGKVSIKQDPTTGDAIVTPKKPDGGTYPSGTKVTIPGVEEPIEIGADGNGKVPNTELPDTENSGDAIVIEPGKDPSEPVSTKTPAKMHKHIQTEAPMLSVINDDTNDVRTSILISTKPNAQVKLVDKEGRTYFGTADANGKLIIDNVALLSKKSVMTGAAKAPGQKVSNPSEVLLPASGISVETSKPEGDAIVKEPDKAPSDPVLIKTPAKTPIELKTDKPGSVNIKQDSATGAVIVTPKKSDGTTYPSGTTVTIPGVEEPIVIGEAGKEKAQQLVNNGNSFSNKKEEKLRKESSVFPKTGEESQSKYIWFGLLAVLGSVLGFLGIKRKKEN